MTLYAETSAVLAWLLGEPPGPTVESALAESKLVVTSDLTLLECDRVFLRSVALGERTSAEARSLGRILGNVVATWNVQPFDASTFDRARQSFPDDRIRALDAIHLASALVARASLGDLDLLSLDERIRSNAAALGIRVLPE